MADYQTHANILSNKLVFKMATHCVLLVVVLLSVTSAKGASIYDVRKIFGILDPSPCPHLGLIYNTKFTQPPLLHLLLG